MILILQIAAGVFLANILGAATSVILQRRAVRQRSKEIASEIVRQTKADAAARAKTEAEGGQYL